MTESVGIGNGNGSYFDLHTGDTGFGQKVDDKTMKAYLIRFGVPPQKIRELGLNTDGLHWHNVEPGTSSREVGKVCNNCRRGNKPTMTCGKCHTVTYCSKKCQTQDWPIHKIFCGLDAIAPTESNGKVRVFVLPDNATVPTVTHLDLRDGRPDFTGIISGYTDKISSDLFTDNSIRKLPSAYDIVFKDDAYVDGTSVMNKCILNLFKMWHRKMNAANEIKDPFWRNRVVVVKRKAGKTNEYEDITSADATEVVKFLYRYTGQKSLFINY